MPRNYSDTSIPLIPVLWNRAWIVLGHNMELQNPASSFKDHHLFYIRNMWLLNRQLIPSTDTRFCLPHLLSHSKTSDQNLCSSCQYLGIKIFAFQGWNRGMQANWGMAFFSYVIPMLYPGERAQSLSQTKMIEKWLKNDDLFLWNMALLFFTVKLETEDVTQNLLHSLKKN